MSKCREQGSRIDEIKEIRGIREQAVSLLARERGEHTALQLDDLFTPFKSLQKSMLQGLDISHGSQALWQQAVVEHKELISPLESRIGEKLQQRKYLLAMPRFLHKSPTVSKREL